MERERESIRAKFQQNSIEDIQCGSKKIIQNISCGRNSPKRDVSNDHVGMIKVHK